MNDIGTTLTVTGLVAAFISLVFAVAALYVSRRRRLQGGKRRPVRLPRTLPHLKVQLPPAEKQPEEEKPKEPDEGKSLFKRLGSQGIEEPVPEETEQSTEYTWE